MKVAYNLIQLEKLKNNRLQWKQKQQLKMSDNYRKSPKTNVHCQTESRLSNKWNMKIKINLNFEVLFVSFCINAN